MSNVKTTKVATQGVATISPAIKAIFTSALSIIASKATLDGKVGQPVVLSIIGNGVALDRGAWLYNTNVSSKELINKALDMLNPEEFFASVTSEEEATRVTRQAMNSASISFSIPFGKGEKLSNGDFIVATVQEYASKVTGESVFGLRFVAKKEAQALSQDSSAKARVAGMRAMVESEDPFQS